MEGRKEVTIDVYKTRDPDEEEDYLLDDVVGAGAADRKNSNDEEDGQLGSGDPEVPRGLLLTPAQLAVKALAARNQVLACLGYGTVSILIVFSNKWVLSTWGLARPNFLSLLQLIITVAGLELARALLKTKYLPTFDRATALRALPVALWSLLNVITGLMGTELLSVPMLSVLRRTATFFVMAAEKLFLGKAAANYEMIAVAIWIFGAAISGSNDLMFNFKGYMAVFANGIATAGFYISSSRANKENQLDSIGLLYYNSILQLPFQAVFFMLSGEAAGLGSFSGWTSPAFVFLLLFTISQAVALNYLIFLCTTLCGPTTTSLTGQIKTVVQTFLGVYIFSVPVTELGWTGLWISSAGVAYYCWYKFR